MKGSVKKLIRIIAFALVLFLCVGVAYKVVSWKDTTGGYLSSVQQLYATEDDLIDVVFLGSSHTYCGIYPEYLWEKKGIAAFDMAVSGQDKDSTYHSLVELLKTQSPKVVFVDLYGLSFEKHEVEGNTYRNYLSMNTSLNSIKHVRSYVEEDKQLEYIFRWPIVHTRYRELQKNDFIQYLPSTFGRGGEYGWHTEYVDFSQDRSGFSETISLNEKNEEWIYKLIDLSREKDFALVFMVLPFYVTSDEVQGQINLTGQIAAENGVAFYDFNQMKDELGLDPSSDYTDTNHLNGFGAVKMTKYIQNNILSNYELTDHRGNEAYAFWDMDLEWYNLEYTKYRLTQTTDLETNLYMLRDNSKLTTIISLDGNMEDWPVDYASLLEIMNIPYGEAASGGKWLYRDGVVTKIADNIHGTEFITDLSNTDTLKVIYNEPYQAANIMIGKQAVGAGGYNMSLVIYDDLIDEYYMTLGY